MSEWRLLGDFDEDGEKRPLEERVAAISERSLLLHENGIVYEIRKLQDPDTREVMYVMEPVAAVLPDVDERIGAGGRLVCRSKFAIIESRHPDEEVRRYVDLARRAAALRELLADPEGQIWFPMPPQWAA